MDPDLLSVVLPDRVLISAPVRKAHRISGHRRVAETSAAVVNAHVVANDATFAVLIARSCGCDRVL